MRTTLFISSVQKELQAERRAIAAFVRGDALLRRYFDVFLFEDLPAADRRADEVYLDEVDRCGVYVGLFADEYGPEDADGLSATEREFNRATHQGKPRLIFVKGSDDKERHPKMLKLIRRASRQLIRRRFADIPDLTAQLYASLVQHLEEDGLLRTVPFDAAAARGASLEDISEEKLRWFLATARRERHYILKEKTPLPNALAHLNLLHDGKPTHAAILLFGHNPQRFVFSAEIKCLHFHGTEVRKPIPSYHIYKGTVFDLVDQAVDFVMSKLARSVGTREDGPQAPVEYELPREAVMEAIVNAVAHRDYDSNAAVQVMLFADRLEVWNPGELPPGLTPEQLGLPHPSIPRNPLICEPMFLAHYVEKAGSGTLDMIARCQQAGLPAPDFEQRAGQFVTTIWRHWLTGPVLATLGLNERQKKAVAYVKVERRITNAVYQRLTGAIRRTALRDLDDLVRKGVLEPRGVKRGAHYVLAAQMGQK
ncbi:MAG TPA: ATP-binding protein [Planctomycetota bacterium]|nr:ATP-binding protein [Planctomycetota bacterium]